MEPGPIPTFTASTPASINALVASPVATFPAISCNSGYFSLISRTAFKIFAECPCAESTTITSTFAFTRASTLAITFAVIPTAAPHKRRP